MLDDVINSIIKAGEPLLKINKEKIFVSKVGFVKYGSNQLPSMCIRDFRYDLGFMPE